MSTRKSSDALGLILDVTDISGRTPDNDGGLNRSTHHPPTLSGLRAVGAMSAVARPSDAAPVSSRDEHESWSRSWECFLREGEDGAGSSVQRGSPVP